MLLSLAVPAAPARAQAALNLSATTNYLYRGYSLSAQRPALVATASWDLPSGPYASASAIAGAGHGRGAALSGYQAYVGYARRFSGDSSWDVGLARTEVSQRYSTRYRVAYDEAYAGVSTRSLSAHVYYSPDYLGEGAATLYATATKTLTPAPGWKIFGAAGVLLPVRRDAGSELRRAQFDASVGVARRLGDLELQAALAAQGPDTGLAAGRPQGHTALSLSATLSF